MPVISALTYFVTDTTIAATWTTDTSADSNLSAGGKSAIDNGVAANGTSHQCIVTGLAPATAYTCFVNSGGTNSSTSTQTTSALKTRILVTSAKNGSVTAGSTSNNQSDTQRTFLSSDNKVYVTQDDGNGIVAATPNGGYNTQIAALSNESTMTGGASLLTAYGGLNTFNGTDGPGGTSMTNKSTGLFGLNGNLHMFVYRQRTASSTNRYANWIKSTDHGATWNNFNDKPTFTAGGNPVTPNSVAEPVQFYSNLIGLVCPVLYAADDGTLGYTTSGNLIDGGNAFVYMSYFVDNDHTALYMMRLPRIQFDAQNATPIQYWKGPTYPSPLDFTSDTNWSSANTDAVNIVPPTLGTTAGITGWVQIYFVPDINSYVMSTWGTYSGGLTTVFQLYSAPTPAGPWTLFFTQPNIVTDKGYYGLFPFHRDVVGVATTSDIAIKHLYSGNPGSANYCINYSTFTLQPSSGAAMTQLVSYGFGTVENPLSHGGTFTSTSGNLQVPSSGVCEVAISGTGVMYYSGAVPNGDTGGTWPADQYVELIIGAMALPGTDFIYAQLRRDPATVTTYILVLSGNTASPGAQNLTVAAQVNGVQHTIATPLMTIRAGDVIRFSITGNVLSLTQNGTAAAGSPYTDTNNYVPAGNPPGLGITSTVVAATQISWFAAGANQAASPTFSPIGTTYSTTQTVTITGPASSTIYYTTDGSTPTRSSSSIASGATISVAATATVKAIASKTNFVDSQISGASYTISSAPASSTGGLPIAFFGNAVD